MYRFLKVVLLGLAASLSTATLLPSYGQVLERNNTTTGSNKSFTFQVQSTYGVSTSASASPNLKVETEAVLNLQKDSYITNSAGKVGGSTGATITTTPNGTNAALSGITADNKFLIDQGTKFRAALSTSEVDGQPSFGNASASAFHNLTVSVTDSQSSFVNSVRQNFEAAP